MSRIEVLLLTKPGCHLCDDARPIVERVVAEVPSAELVERDITTDAALNDKHWELIRFLRTDHAAQGETATLRLVSTQTGTPVKELFGLFPGKPAKKMAYVSGLPKPKGCV